MRPGGLLDGFPVHLLAGVDDARPLVVIDAPDLGRLVTAGVPGAGVPTLVIGRDLARLRATRTDWDDTLGPAPLAVCADPATPPFRDACVGGVVSRRPAPAGFAPALTADSCQLVIETPDSLCRHREFGRTTWIRPASGREYFATSSWNPTHWPFAGIQLGRLRDAQLRVNRLLSRLPLPRLHDGVRVRVRGGAAERSPLDAWWPRSGGDADRVGLFVKVAWNAILFGAESGRRVAKFPLIDVAAARMDEHAGNLESLDLAGDLAEVVPRVLERGQLGGQEFQVENACPGAPATRVPWRPRRSGSRAAWRERALGGGFEFLLELHAESQAETLLSRDLFDQFLKPPIETIEADAQRLDASFDLEPLREALWDVFGDRRVPLVRTHGDFWPGNLLVDASGRLTGVLDWDASVARGWALLDALQLLAFQHKRRAFWHFGATINQRLAARRLTRFEDALATSYCARLGIPAEHWTAYVALYWLERASQWLVTDFHEGKRNDAWLQRNVLDALPGLLDRVRASSARR